MRGDQVEAAWQALMPVFKHGGKRVSQFPITPPALGTGGGGFADETRRTSLAFADLIGGSKHEREYQVAFGATELEQFALWVFLKPPLVDHVLETEQGFRHNAKARAKLVFPA